MFQIMGALSRIVADVTKSHMLRTYSVADTLQHHEAIMNSRTWTVAASVTPVGPSDYFLYIRNTSANYPLLITRIEVDTAAAETVEIHQVTGTQTGGTAVVPNNRTVSSDNQPQAIVESGTDILGLSKVGGTYESLKSSAALGTFVLDLNPRPIVLSASGTANGVAAFVQTGAIAVDIFVDITELRIDELNM